MQHWIYKRLHKDCSSSLDDKDLECTYCNTTVHVAWPRPDDPALLVKEEESLRQVLSYWENNDPNHTWETLSLALMSDRIYKELGASLYFKHVKPGENSI